jgi:hypothetical protein
MKRILALAALMLLSAACFDPNLEGARCGSAGECPEGFTCGVDGLCHSGNGPDIDANIPPGPDVAEGTDVQGGIDVASPPDVMSGPDVMVDPCDTVTCSAPAVCVGGTCECPPGWVPNGANGCNEIDECADGTAGCNPNATCSNSPPGSFTCTCNPGYVGDGFTCTNIDECATMMDFCSPDAFCMDVSGSYTCVCNPGFSGDGFTCTDDDECALGTDLCSPDATCTNSPGSYSCACNGGFTGDGFVCTDNDECALGTAGCDVNAFCTNTPGSFFCTCNGGYSGDGFTCADIDECALGTHGCSVNGFCTNLIGGYTCTCNPGYGGDGFTCAPLSDECEAGIDNCSSAATCTDTGTGFTCACGLGWTGDGVTCDRPRGQIIAMAHDFFLRNANVDRLIWNAVAMANTTGTINILGYQQYSDTSASGEVVNTNNAITSLAPTFGRTVAITPLTDYTTLAANLAGKNVLVIYEQELGVPAPATIGAAWAPILRRFLAAGGIIIHMEFLTSGWQILDNTGLIDLGGPVVYSSANFDHAITTDPLLAGVANPYTETSGSGHFGSAPEGLIVVTQSGLPAVIRKPWPCAFIGTDSFGYTACVEAVPDGAPMPCPDINTTGTLGPTGDDQVTAVTLPFTFTYYGVAQTSVGVVTNGKLGFPGTFTYSNTCTIETNTIAAYWDDLYPPSGGSVRYQTMGTAPNQQFVTSWHVPHIQGPATSQYDIRATLDQTTNNITVCYVDTYNSNNLTNYGISATVGIMGPAAAGIQYSCNAQGPTNGMVIRYIAP